MCQGLDRRGKYISDRPVVNLSECGMPFRWVSRRDVEGRETAPAIRGHIEGAIVSEPGVRTIEECVAALIETGESCVGTSNKRPVMKAGALVGYIDISK